MKRVEMEKTNQAIEAIRHCLNGSPDIYVQLNALRDWMNAHYPGFELYLEDIWNDVTPGETHIQYIFRSLKTFNETEVLGYDRYYNHRDGKGVWHLDDYIASVRLIEDPLVLLDFIRENE